MEEMVVAPKHSATSRMYAFTSSSTATSRSRKPLSINGMFLQKRHPRTPNHHQTTPGARCHILVHTEFTRGLGWSWMLFPRCAHCILAVENTTRRFGKGGWVDGGLEVGWKVFNIKLTEGWLKLVLVEPKNRGVSPKMDGENHGNPY